jgi:putative spermidine/putrescine transport system permease protein
VDEGLGRGEGIATTSAARRASRALDAHPRGKLLALLSAPLAWLALAYIGSLTALLITAFYKTDPFTTQIVKEFTLQNFSDLFDPAYRTVAIRTILVAATVTVIDFLIALPMAFTLAKVVSDRARRILLVLVLMPLWASYLVKAYSWRAMLAPNGIVHEVFGHTPGYGLAATIITLSYLWLPYMIIPIYAGLERLPNSMLEAASDLGAKSGRTFFSVVVPLLKPAIIAGSIFTFSLSLGDYISVDIVGGTTQMIGNVVLRNFGANNIPFAAALATIPVAVMVIYLTAVRRTGALDNL